MADTTRSTPNNSAVYIRGTQSNKAVVALEIAAADVISGGELIPICELAPEDIVTSIKVLNETLDSGTDALFDIGIYKATRGLSLDEIIDASAYSALDADIYVDGTQEFYTANAILTELLGTGATAAAAGTNAVDADNMYKPVRELAGVTIGEDPFKYFLGMKAQVGTVSGAAAGAVVFHVETVQA